MIVGVISVGVMTVGVLSVGVMTLSRIDDEVKAGVPRQYFYTLLFKQCFVRKQLYFPEFGLCSIYTCPTLKGYCLPQSYFFHTQNYCRFSY
jgi:hypothetical protein